MKASSIKKYAYLLIGILIIIIAYQILSSIKQDEFVYPNVLKIFKQVGIILTTAHSYLIIFKTVLRIVLIIVASIILSTILSMLYFKFKGIAYLLNPLINIFKAAPFAIIAIYLFLSIGNKNAPYFMCFFVIFPIILEGFMTALDNVDVTLKDDLKLLDISIFQKFFKGFLPICMPYIIMSILQSFGLGIKTMIMAEYLCNIDDSIGQLVYNVKYTMDFDVLLAWLVIVVAIVCLIDLLIRFISKKVVKN